MQRNVFSGLSALPPPRRRFRALARLAVLACAGVMLGSSLWLTTAVPVSTQDLRDASWLFGFQSMDRVSGLSLAIGLAMCLIGLVISVLRKRWISLVFGVSVGFILILSGRPAVQFMAAVDYGAAKVGCFDWDMKECQALVGLPGKALPSMYAPREQADRSGDVLSPSYRAAVQTELASVNLIPELGGLLAPFLVLDADEINTKLVAQRAELARRRAAAVKH